MGHTDSFKWVKRPADVPKGARSSSAERKALACPASCSGDFASSAAVEPSWKLTGRTGAFCYMAPEVLRNQAYNEKVDVFSFGIMLFEVFSKRLMCADYMNGGADYDESEVHAHRWLLGGDPPSPCACLRLCGRSLSAVGREPRC